MPRLKSLVKNDVKVVTNDAKRRNKISGLRPAQLEP